MLALWSRAARNPGTCRCISCVSNTSAVARRAGTVATKGAWALGTPTSTFYYTAIFAAGLAMDARAKRNRNEQWETAFAHMQQELNQPCTNDLETEQLAQQVKEIEKRPVVVPIERLVPEGVDWDIIHRVSGMGLVEDEVFERRQIQVDLEQLPEELWDLLSFDSRLPGGPTLEWPANTGPDLIRHYLPPQSLWSPDRMRWTAVRRRQTWKKLAIQELSVGVLIHALIAHGDLGRLSPEAFASASLSPHIESVARLNPEQNRSARTEILKNIEKLQALAVEAPPEQITNARVSSHGAAIPRYFQDDDGDYHLICKQMNTAIKNLLHGKDRGLQDDDQLALAIAKICHNLLVSSAAPDLQTFNVIIAGLKRSRRPRLVDDVIAALEGCKVRPNEITCAAIMDHYVQTNRPEHFSKYVAYMRGVGNALMLADPNIHINEKGQARLVRVNENKVYQKVHPTPIVFNTLMLGVLRFAGFERALEIYYEMKDDGWGLDALGLSHFLDDCIQRADWHGGVFIWQEINRIKHKVKPTHMSRAYSKMLSLCSVTGNTVAWNQILNEVVRRRFDRGRIVASAESMTRAARKQGVSSAPAWTADNLLIAVSGYMDDNKVKELEVSSPLGEADPFEPITEREKTAPEQTVARDPDEAWAAWMEHELGEPMAKGYKKEDVFDEVQDSVRGSKGQKAPHKSQTWTASTNRSAKNSRNQDASDELQALANAGRSMT